MSKKNELIVFSDEQKKVIRNQFFPPSATDTDMQYCMGVAKELGLNPITKQIWFVERKSQVNGQWITKIEPMAGRDSYLAIAHRSGQFGGIETVANIETTPILENGEWVEKKELVATCKVYKKGIDKPFIASVNYNEYVQKTKQGQPTKFWAEKPHTMLKKVAESQALRKAFNISGVYDEVEVRQEYQEVEVINHGSSENRLLKNKLDQHLENYGMVTSDIKEFKEKNNLNDVDTIRFMLDNPDELARLIEIFEKEQDAN